MIPDEAIRARREAVVRQHMESENVHDFDTTIATFSHPRYELVPSGAVHDGEAAVRAYFKETRTAFPDQRNELIALRHLDDGVVVEFWLRGTHEGPLQGARPSGRDPRSEAQPSEGHALGFEPTGRAFECRMCAFFLFDGDRIVCERVYYDTATILRQLTG
jgi:ketosteroid isomerase-like protein